MGVQILLYRCQLHRQRGLKVYAPTHSASHGIPSFHQFGMGRWSVISQRPVLANCNARSCQADFKQPIQRHRTTRAFLGFCDIAYCFSVLRIFNLQLRKFARQLHPQLYSSSFVTEPSIRRELINFKLNVCAPMCCLLGDIGPR
jgi:hypothetical protein